MASAFRKDWTEVYRVHHWRPPHPRAGWPQKKSVSTKSFCRICSWKIDKEDPVTISSYEGAMKVEERRRGTRCHPHSLPTAAGHGVVDPSEQQLSLAGPSSTAGRRALRYHRDQRLGPSLKFEDQSI